MTLTHLCWLGRRCGERNSAPKPHRAKRARLKLTQMPTYSINYRLIRTVIYAVAWLPSQITLLLAVVLNPLVRVRIGSVEGMRIGDFQPIDLYLRRKSLNQSHKRNLSVFVGGGTSNPQLMEMVKRRMRVFEGRFAVRQYTLVRRCTRWSRTWVDLPCESREWDVYKDTQPQLSFSREEEDKGSQLLSNMGIPGENEFVCFHGRDQAYLDTIHSREPGNWYGYNEHRNCNINNFLPAADYMASLGVYALRTGYVVEKPLNGNNPKIIDYSSHHRTDFGDVYLGAKAKFFLGVADGLVAIPYMFGVPVAETNSIPFVFRPLRATDLFIPKKMWDTGKNRLLTFREIIESGVEDWSHAGLYKQAGIELIENTEDEILAVAKEMNQRLDGDWVANEEDEELQERFRSLHSPSHYSYGFPSRMGAQFLRENRALLE